MTLYLDTSAAAKLLVEERESDACARYLDAAAAEARVVSSALLETELRRLTVRLGLAQAAVSEVLSRVDLAEPDRALFTEAGLLPGPALRSLDALHIATAIRLGADRIAAYDHRLRSAAESVGLRVVSPADDR